MALLTTKDSEAAEEMATDFHFPTSNKALIIFVRNSELGKCKTRLAQTIGNVKALEVYKFLLDHTAAVAENVQADRFIFYSEYIVWEDLWNLSIFKKKIQKGTNLGERMHNAFLELFESGYQKVVIIGSDLLDLDAELVNQSFTQLHHNEVVLGPAMDGGYYLLGMKHLVPQVFYNKKWGTDSVAEDTLEDLKNSKVCLLKKLNDIDTFDDLQQYQELKNIIAKHD